MSEPASNLWEAIEIVESCGGPRHTANLCYMAMDGVRVTVDTVPGMYLPLAERLAFTMREAGYLQGEGLVDAVRDARLADMLEPDTSLQEVRAGLQAVLAAYTEGKSEGFHRPGNVERLALAYGAALDQGLFKLGEQSLTFDDVLDAAVAAHEALAIGVILLEHGFKNMTHWFVQELAPEEFDHAEVWMGEPAADLDITTHIVFDLTKGYRTEVKLLDRMVALDPSLADKAMDMWDLQYQRLKAFPKLYDGLTVQFLEHVSTLADSELAEGRRAGLQALCVLKDNHPTNEAYLQRTQALIANDTRISLLPFGRRSRFARDTAEAELFQRLTGVSPAIHPSFDARMTEAETPPNT